MRHPKNVEVGGRGSDHDAPLKRVRFMRRLANELLKPVVIKNETGVPILPANTEHPSFPQPTEPTSVWRYMDLSRYLDVATRGRLFFSRQDRFRDTFEGSIPFISRTALAFQSKQIQEEQKKLKSEGNFQEIQPSMEAQMMGFLERIRRQTFISCWHMNSGESAAMWDLYGRDGSAIAFKTSYTKLCEALPSDIYLGMVKYIDFEKDYFALDNIMNPTMHKRRSFEHEKEVRAMIQHFNEASEDYKLDHEVTQFGLTIPFDINIAIDEIHLSPEAKPWFVKMIQETNTKLGITTPLKKSSLYDAAIF